jgi:cytoskeletal protein CcmA (bactofilin family)
MDTNNQPPAESDELEGAASAEEGASPAPAVAAAGTPAPAPAANGKPPKQVNPVTSLVFGNKYLLIFGLLFMAAAVGIFVVVQGTKKSAAPVTVKKSSLTADELTALKGNTTIVGDSQQTLDVQSNSVFEGQVVMRGNLEVAGNLKFSSPLSLPSLSVNGISTLGQTNTGNLSVAGTTILQNQVNVQQNLSVAGTASFGGAISAPQISVSNLLLAGDLLLPRHITTTGGIPTRVAGPAIGTDGTASVGGSDTAGTITFNTGTGTTAGTLVDITFAQRYVAPPHIVVSPVSLPAAGIDYYIIKTNAGFTLKTTTAPPANSNFSFDYIVMN